MSNSNLFPAVQTRQEKYQVYRYSMARYAKAMKEGFFFEAMLDALDMFCYEYTPILIQFLKNWGALILAAASFAVSVVSLKRTSKAQDSKIE